MGTYSIKRMERINVTRIFHGPLMKEFSPIFVKFDDSNIVFFLVNPVRSQILSFNKPTHDLHAKVLFVQQYCSTKLF